MYLISTVPQDITDKLNEVIKGKNLQPANMDLAGNIKNEFLIPEGKEHVYPLIFALIDKHKEQYPQHFKKITGYTGKKEISLQLHSLWVNFQKKYEFNPIHVHEGLFSFVFWHKIPYKIENEIARYPNMKPDQVKAGHFAFLQTNEMGRIQSIDLPVDNSWEGKIALFPADLNHTVYPFFTSDDVRITISGNVGFPS
jgi:hypothetical protein|tara:strand:+ start:240 stop:830 length:591 start_codon:yes stop_codon:yes gene_type:complete